MKKYLLPEKGNFYKANLHTHSTISDGKLTPEAVKEAYKELHDYISLQRCICFVKMRFKKKLLLICLIQFKVRCMFFLGTQTQFIKIKQSDKYFQH